VTSKDEIQALQTEIATLMKQVVALEAERDEMKRRIESAKPPPAAVLPASDAVEQTLRRIVSLRELLVSTASELSQLHADEVALSAKRARILGDSCALLSRAVGETGQAPPPIPLSIVMPSAALEARLSIRPVVDISEVADLIESLRPPLTPKVEPEPSEG